MTGSLDTNVSLAPRVQPAEVLGRLRLTAGKAAEVCGITRRQLCYWTDKGIIPCCNPSAGRDPSRRIYDFTGLRKALMLRHLMDEGRGLRRAVRELKTRWVETPAPNPHDPGVSDEHSMLIQAERLGKLGDRVREVSGRKERREALVRLALALQPLAELSRAARDGGITVTNGRGARDLGPLLAEAERAAGQAG